MTIFPNQRLIFLHIPKTAGRALKAQLQVKEGTPVNLFFPHLFAGEYVSKGYLTQAQWDAYDKITVVRNPWDRAASAFKYWVDANGIRNNPWMRNPNHFGYYVQRPNISFADFLDDFIGSGWKYRRHAEPQTRFLDGFDGRIYRYENLARDFPGLPRVNVSPILADYKTFYTDATRKRVGEAYAADIERFGYDFHGAIDGKTDDKETQGAA